MEQASCVDLTGTVSSVRLLKINGYHATATMTKSEYIKAVWNVDGHDWEVRCYPQLCFSLDWWVALKLTFLGEAQAQPRKVRATLICRLVDPTGKIRASEGKSTTAAFSRPKDSSGEVLLVTRDHIRSSGYLYNDSVTVQCTITVFKELPDVVIPAPAKEEVLEPIIPPSDLHRHLGKLFLSQKGADVTFVVRGESFAAHKGILAARSPVFMAEFFGHMKETHSRRVEVEDMEAAVFGAMLRFIYTDEAAELDEKPSSSMAEHLLAAADRYGLDRLKVICERRLAGGIGVDTAAATLALAEQHGCSLLKARCVEFIVGSPEKLDAVLATEGYKHLAASCPLVLAELLKAARGRKN